MNLHPFLVHFPIAFITTAVLAGSIARLLTSPWQEALRFLASLTGNLGAAFLLVIVVALHPDPATYGDVVVQHAIAEHQSLAFFAAIGAAVYLLLAVKERKHQISGETALVRRLQTTRLLISWLWLATLTPLVIQGMRLAHK